jgi:hypothetical protein
MSKRHRRVRRCGPTPARRPAPPSSLLVDDDEQVLIRCGDCGASAWMSFSALQVEPRSPADLGLCGCSW